MAFSHLCQIPKPIPWALPVTPDTVTLTSPYNRNLKLKWPRGSSPLTHACLHFPISGDGTPSTKMFKNRKKKKRSICNSMYLCVVQFHASHTCSWGSLFLEDSFRPLPCPLYQENSYLSFKNQFQHHHPQAGWSHNFLSPVQNEKVSYSGSHHTFGHPKPRNWSLCTGHIWNLIEGKRDAPMSCLDKNTMELPTQAGNKCHLAPPKTQWSTSPALTLLVPMPGLCWGWRVMAVCRPLPARLTAP